MRKLAVSLALATGIALAAPDAPLPAFKGLPPLPAAATTGLDCSIGAAMRKKVDEIAERGRAAISSGAMSAPAMSMSPEQMQAMQALSDPAFSMCPIEVMQLQATGWNTAPEQKLDARLTEIHAAKATHDRAYCEAHPKNSIECETDPASARRFNAQAVAAGTQYLKDMQPGYAKLLKQAGDCLALRDKPVRAAQGVSGAFAAMADGALAQDWGLVSTVAEAHSQACAKARDAATKYLGP